MNDNDQITLGDVLSEAETALKRLDEPLDTSLDGLASTLVYYWDIEANMKTTVEILGEINRLLKEGRPQFFGKDKWDNQLVKLLELFVSQKEEIFGESISQSIYNVPGGCKQVWFNYVKIFYETEKLTSSLVNFINGKDKNGLPKVYSDIRSITTYINQFAKERDDLLNNIFHSGFDIDTIFDRAKQIQKSNEEI